MCKILHFIQNQFWDKNLQFLILLKQFYVRYSFITTNGITRLPILIFYTVHLNFFQQSLK